MPKGRAVSPPCRTRQIIEKMRELRRTRNRTRRGKTVLIDTIGGPEEGLGGPVEVPIEILKTKKGR